MKKVLFVCSGNTCRSPLAEGIAKTIFPKKLLKEIEISSAGTSALDGLPASRLAIEVAEEHSIDISKHQARLLSRTFVREADLIITMSSKHKETVGVIEPDALRYTYLLSDICGEKVGDIPDPIGMDKKGYEKTFRLIEKCLARFSNRMSSFDGWKNKEG